MKPELIFVFDNTGWPALLAEEGGTIRRADLAAQHVFGPMGEAPLLNSLWAPENETSAELFMAKAERFGANAPQVKFRIKGGVIGTFATFISPIVRDNQKYLFFQLLKEIESPAAAETKPAPAETPVPAIDSNLAHKQKLDCA